MERETGDSWLASLVRLAGAALRLVCLGSRLAWPGWLGWLRLARSPVPAGWPTGRLAGWLADQLSGQAGCRLAGVPAGWPAGLPAALAPCSSQVFLK